MRYLKYLVSLALLYFTQQTSCKNAGASRQGKLFPVFNVVSFKNAQCSTGVNGAGGSNYEGTCYTESQCASRGGMSSGSCASGFGICCLFYKTSGDIRENCTYIRNEGYPAEFTGTSSPSYTIHRCNNDVCSIRLDFEMFLINGPADTLENQGGVCQDTMTLMGSTGEVYPVICGLNSGQHVYVEIGNRVGDTAKIDFAFTGSGSRKFEMKATQIPCGARERPPEGCFQYHTGLSGTLSTFNFFGDTQHLANHQYNICIRQEVGYCCVEYTVCNEPNSFSILTMKAPDSDVGTGVIDDHCDEGDHIIINGASNNCNLSPAGGIRTAGKLCGTSLYAHTTNELKGKNVPVCDCVEPFDIGIRTDNKDDQGAMGAVVNKAQSRGICLMWRQLPCQ